MSGHSRWVCECHGQQSDGVRCNHDTRRCLKTARAELRQATRNGQPPGPWYRYCDNCADAIVNGLTNPLDRRRFQPGARPVER